MIALSENQREATRKRQIREDARVVPIPDPADIRRRRRLEKSDVKWLMWYFGDGCGCDDPFWYEFTSQQLEMISAIRHAIEFGGDQSIAASRGEGKTTICERLLLKYTLQGVTKFPVLFSATGDSATNSLDSIKVAIESNDRLCDDYPEVCVPVRALEHTPNRAHYQLVSGTCHDDRRRKFEKHPSKFSWCGREVIFPDVPGSPSRGAIIATRGLDAAVRGLKKRGRRPDVAIIDDPDTEDTARSEDQATKLRARIDKAIGGLGGQQRGIARVLLTTLQSRISVSYALTDRAESPSWKPKRFRFLVKQPDRQDLWDEYVERLQQDWMGGDDFGRGAFGFYLSNRAKMDAGAEVANPNRFNGEKLPDGTKAELSALQRYYNEVAHIGREAVLTEYDNDPPEEAGPMESAISPARIMRQLNGYPRCVVPPETVCLVQGIDVGKMALHWVVRAWRSDCTGYTVAYGVQDVHGTVIGSDEGVDVCIRRAIMARMDEARSQFFTPDGDSVRVDLTLVDARYRMDAVKATCLEIGKDIWPAVGIGKSHGCVRSTWVDLPRRRLVTIANNVLQGDGWKQDFKRHCVDFYADKWKAWEQDRWMTDPPLPGSLTLFGTPSAKGERPSDDQRQHHSYAHHICNEKEVEEIVKGALKRYWKVKGPNHWLDASCMSDVAANMLGVSLLGVQKARKSTEKKDRKTLAEMASGA